ncbi:MAG: carboxypeptidase-like regulatory domain-containing protein [Gemmatimonadales bacterium]
MKSYLMLVSCLLAVPSIGLVDGVAPIAAQAGSGTIKGVVMTASPRQPLEGVRIRLMGTPLNAVSDSKGRFQFRDLDPGKYVIEAAAIGYTTMNSPLLLGERETLELEFHASSEAVRLPDVTVEERAEHGPRDWLRRKSEGRGRYITRKHLEERRITYLPDALRMVAGVRVECRGSVCRAQMIRSQRGCGPGYYIDGIPAHSSALWLTPVNEIEGIEVYSGPSETPPELETGNTSCGAIALWTRPPPPRRPKEPKPEPEPAPADSTTTEFAVRR